MKPLKIILVLISSAFLLNFNLIPGNTLYKLKAAYLQKFALFINWSESANISDTTKPFIITVFGENSFKDELVSVYNDEKIKILNKPVQLQFVKSVDEIKTCHLLVVTESESDKLEDILTKVENNSVLVICDYNGGAADGAHINFIVTDEGKLHFEINKERAINSEVKINSRLLKIAKLVS